MADASSGFLSDYSALKPIGDKGVDFGYVAEEATGQFTDRNAVFITQPEIFIAENSKYKGLRPDEAKAVADAFKVAISESLSEDYKILPSPIPDSFHIRVALTDLHLKKRRTLIDFTPVGVITNTIPGVSDAKDALQQAVLNDVSKRVSLVELKIELEILDGESGKPIAALVEKHGRRKDDTKEIDEDPTSWDKLNSLMYTYGERLACRLRNTRVPKSETVHCNRFY